MITRATINRSLYLAGGFAILALTGIFGSFAELEIIAGSLTMSTVLLVVMLGGMGFYTASTKREDGFVPMLTNAAVSAVVIAAVLAVLSLIVFTDEPKVRAWVIFTFPNLSTGMYDILTFGQGLMPGLLILLGVAAGMGAVASLLFLLPDALRRSLLTALSLSIVLGLMQSQLLRIIPLLDALILVSAFAISYVVVLVVPGLNFYARAGVGLVVGAVVGGAASFLVSGGMFSVNELSIILVQEPLFVWLLAIGALTGVMGAIAASSPASVNSSILYVVFSLVIMGLINWQRGMTLLGFGITFVLLLVLSLIVTSLQNRAANHYEKFSFAERSISRNTLLVLGLAVAMIAPTFLGSSLTYAMALVGLYIIMGIGLNIVVGYAGLLDLGHVGFFAIGAYTIGLLTSPTIVTCGIPADDVLLRDVAQVREMQPLDMEQTEGMAYFFTNDDDLLEPLTCRTWNFWFALPVAVAMAGSAGMILGIPVLRLRGDYLAIVTLGLSEIISIVIGASSFKHIFGSAQGISPIPSPIIDLSWIRPAWELEFFSADIYYLVVPGILFATFVSQRLVNSRIGRAWRSMRADEDVAEAMGIDLVRNKLSAFGISAAFAGLAGAFFGAGLQGAFPNSFTLLVSINVLSMIIIGGLGSIPGVMVGALMLVGLPEILREIDDYRLLVFGMLLVGTMLLKPEGLIPPPVRRIAEEAHAHGETAGQAQAAQTASGD